MDDKSTPKLFVLDTNVLLHNHEALKSFADNEVVIPFTVIEELDKFKKDNDEKGRNARGVIRTLDRLRSEGSLRDGVPNEAGGRIRVMFDYGDLNEAGLIDKPDNRIISTAYLLQKAGDRKVIFVTKDINARIKADALGLKVMDFEKQKINFDELYGGWKEITVEHGAIDRFYQQGTFTPPPDTLFPNEGIRLVSRDDPKHSALGRYDAGAGQVVRLIAQDKTIFGVQARNMEQEFAMDFLLDDRIQLVTLIGQAGTGKTLLALACALHKTLRDRKYERILVSRPVIPMGRDIGYLPGSKEEKLENWMQPIFDNLEFLLEARGVNGKAEKGTQALIDNGTITLEALTYIRGRSISRQYVIIDEAQNLTPHEVKTIISRAGAGSKMVLTGDPYQIDNPYLDSSSNGLTYVAERMKGQELFAHITLTKSERGILASLAAQLL
jgi:PhoH-like ATPase